MVALLLALACDVSSIDTADTGAVSAGQEVWFVLDWAEPATAITEGWLVSFSVELLPCQETASLSLIPTAHAGHGVTGEAALRQLRAPRAESLTDGFQAQLGHLSPAAGEYCELFYLVSYTTDVYDNAGLPDEVDLVGEGLSLFIRRDGVPATAATGYGVKRTIVDEDGSPAPLVLTEGGDDALLRLTRDASVLDELSHASATQLLAALAESTVVTVEL